MMIFSILVMLHYMLLTLEKAMIIFGAVKGGNILSLERTGQISLMMMISSMVAPIRM